MAEVSLCPLLLARWRGEQAIPQSIASVVDNAGTLTFFWALQSIRVTFLRMCKSVVISTIKYVNVSC